MEDSFVKRYLQRVADTKSVLCVGMDPTPEHVPLGMRSDDIISGIRTYLREVIDIAVPLVPVVKPQFAYYAALGNDGLSILRDLIEYAHGKDLLVILDAKRADIGETMEHYGEEVFGKYNADACTFVPYLGSTFNPSWMKWLKQGRMPISMIRTSNPEAETIQDLELKESGLKIYEHLAQLVAGWNAEVIKATDGAGRVGGVVGATWPEQAVRCRELAGDEVFFLIPGYGAQGGGADGAVGGLPNSRGELMGTVNSSRGITLMSWWDRNTKQPREGDPLELVKKAIEAANTDLNTALERKLGIPMAEIVSPK
ncbi:MAG: orotidine-5'-phosphate decarboxylase [Desulfitobacteriaceae bacterium]|nr:orotidine-5'-phosphate decarboxylase [Desulfitobacteriaceae bacterium]